MSSSENGNTGKYITLAGERKGNRRIESIDILRGAVMIIMALDHVRNFLHADALHYSPTDLSQTSPVLFFTRFVTHYCAPVFVLLAGMSAYLYGTRKSRKELSVYLFSRGMWLIFVELFIIVLGKTFNPTYPYFNLQVIWAIGVAMVFLSVLIYLPMRVILVTGVVLIASHNLLDNLHFPNNFLWAILHETADFHFGHITVFVQYPLIPWIGIMALGYCFGQIYMSDYGPERRKSILLTCGIGSIILFVFLRSLDIYGDTAHWSLYENPVFSLLSFLNLTKYPPSLLYTLAMLGPAFIILAYTEKPLNGFTAKIAVFGRVPFFYYVVHIYLIHLIALIAAYVTGYNLLDMILADRLNNIPALKGFGFNLFAVYVVWVGLILLLYPACKRFDQYKKSNQSHKWWLSYT